MDVFTKGLYFALATDRAKEKWNAWADKNNGYHWDDLCGEEQDKLIEKEEIKWLLHLKYLMN